MPRLSPRFRSQQFFLCNVCGKTFYLNFRIFFLLPHPPPLYTPATQAKIYRDLFGDAMLVPIRMGTNVAAGNQQKHLSVSFATKACIYPSRNSKTLK